MTFAFTQIRNFLLLLFLLLLLLRPPPLKSQSEGPNSTLETDIWPQGWDMGLKTGIWASRLEFKGGGEEGEGEGRENSPHV